MSRKKQVTPHGSITLPSRAHLLRVVLFLLLLLAVVGKQGIAQTLPPSDKPLSAQWQIIREARFILYGTLVPPATTAPDENGVFLQELHSVQVLKGELPKDKSLTVAQFYLSQKTPAEQMRLRYVQGLYNKPILVFVESVDPKTNVLGVLPAKQETILPAGLGSAAAVRAELDNQAAIVAALAGSPFVRPDYRNAWDKKVKQTLDRLVHDAKIVDSEDTPPDNAKKRQRKVVDEMKQWGPEAVPALIRQMGDRRDLPGLLVGYPNPPGFWESEYYAAPLKVVDVIAALLCLFTDTHLSADNITSGGTEAQRVSVTQSWQIYLFYLQRGRASQKGASG